MNEANIVAHLRRRLDSIARAVKAGYQDIEGHNRRVVDVGEEIAILKIEYTSLLNTMLAYDYTEDQMIEDGYVTIEDNKG